MAMKRVLLLIAFLISNLVEGTSSATDLGCARDVENLFKHQYVNAKYSKQMISFSGKRRNDLGSYPSCMALPDDHATYCLIETKLVEGGLPLNTFFAECLPTSCKDVSAEKLLPFILGNASKLVSDVEMHCGNNKKLHVSVGDIVVATLCLLLVLASLAATALHYFESEVSEEPQCDEPRTPPRSGTNPGGQPSAVSQTLTTPLMPLASTNDANPSRPPAAKIAVSTARSLLLCFALQTNTKDVFTRGAARKYTSLDGIRGISMMWIILGHTVNFQALLGFENEADTYGQLTKFSFQFVIGGEYAVDTFFFLSGFLSTYVAIRRLGRGKTIPLVPAIVHRYLRLTPTLAFCVALYATLPEHMSQGPFWYKYAHEIRNCPKWWWSHLVYLNNFFPKHYHHQCMPWTWYLANDFQFFILGLLILVLYARTKRGAAALTGLLIIVSSVAAGVITDYYDLDTGASDETHDKLYDKPYIRMGAYLVGVLVAMLFAEVGDRKLPRKAASAAMIFAIGIMAVQVYILYNSYHHPWTRAAKAAYNSLTRLGFTVGLAVMVYLCVTNQGGLVQTFLSSDVLYPLATLTYCAYLVHPMIMRVVYFSRTQLFYHTDIEYASTYCGFLLAAYATATVVHLLVEVPFANLEGLLLKRA
ncbi:hypothetical protein CYMTET_48950 [Cymbomonas tetramitiformis]|uniref:Acyltransferase 3 domain-containing protein n=1 Tax=Cymbomonas tetramitiformis TaxID=36881 RepID=A0AAE0EV78_9CHLO|nr:hypothetical protein CYMTET_48950 [Cymbomonas tetramitiformis]|eukprot:gene16836-20002_t